MNIYIYIYISAEENKILISIPRNGRRGQKKRYGIRSCELLHEDDEL